MKWIVSGTVEFMIPTTEVEAETKEEAQDKAAEIARQHDQVYSLSEVQVRPHMPIMERAALAERRRREQGERATEGVVRG